MNDLYRVFSPLILKATPALACNCQLLRYGAHSYFVVKQCGECTFISDIMKDDDYLSDVCLMHSLLGSAM